MVKKFLTGCPSTPLPWVHLLRAAALTACKGEEQQLPAQHSPRTDRLIWIQIQTHWVSLLPSCSIKKHLGHTGLLPGLVQGFTIWSKSEMETHHNIPHSFKIKYIFYWGYSHPTGDNAHIPDANYTLGMETRVLFTFPLQACSPATRSIAGSSRRGPTSLHRANWIICANQTAELLPKCPAQPPVRGSTHAPSTEPWASSVGGAAQLQARISKSDRERRQWSGEHSFWISYESITCTS